MARICVGGAFQSVPYVFFKLFGATNNKPFAKLFFCVGDDAKIEHASQCHDCNILDWCACAWHIQAETHAHMSNAHVYGKTLGA